MSDQPYRVTPIFDEQTLPQALRLAHNTKAGVWGDIRVLEGVVRYFADAESDAVLLLTRDHPGLIEPQRLHRVEPQGRMRMQVEFYDHRPAHHA